MQDIYNHFESKDLIVTNIKSLTNNSTEIPFNVNEWSPSTGVHGKNYYTNRFWKVEVIDSEQNAHIKWVNTGHLFLYKMYFIEKTNNEAST